MKEVRPPKRPLIFYYCVAVLILLLFNFLAMPWLAQRQIQEVDYNTFVEMLEDGQVGLVQLQEQENRVLFTNTEETAVYKTALVGDPDLTQRVLDAGASLTGEEIQQTDPILSFLLSWVLPIVIFIALGQYLDLYKIDNRIKVYEKTSSSPASLSPTSRRNKPREWRSRTTSPDTNCRWRA